MSTRFRQTWHTTASQNGGVDQAGPAPELSEPEAFALGTEAYVYGYPLVTMELTRRVLTNAAAADDAPMVAKLAKLGIVPGKDFDARKLDRATVTAIGLGANRPEDAVYPTSTRDADGKLYDAEFFFVANLLNRYTLSPRNALKLNKDGSLDLYLQAESPGKDKETNLSILDGCWKPPAVKPAK